MDAANPGDFRDRSRRRRQRRLRRARCYDPPRRIRHPQQSTKFANLANLRLRMLLHPTNDVGPEHIPAITVILQTGFAINHVSAKRCQDRDQTSHAGMRAAMHPFPHTVFVAAGLPTPFGRGGGALAPAMMLSAYRFLSYGPWPRRTRPCRLGKRDPQPRLEQYRARDLARRQAQSQRHGILCRACVFD